MSTLDKVSGQLSLNLYPQIEKVRDAALSRDPTEAEAAEHKSVVVGPGILSLHLSKWYSWDPTAIVQCSALGALHYFSGTSVSEINRLFQDKKLAEQKLKETVSELLEQLFND